MSVAGTAGEESRHPGAGRGRARHHPKGRQVDTAALAEIRELLGERPRRRDLLIEHLHLVQDRHGHLSTAHLVALADEMGLAMAEIYEVATFYAHFDVVPEGETPPAPVTVRVCDSLACALRGGERLLEELRQGLDGEARVVRAPCMGRCDRAPAVAVGHRALTGISLGTSVGAVRAAIASTGEPAATPEDGAETIDYDAYVGSGGYRLLDQCLEGERQVAEIIATLEASDLRGLGGAGFPAGRKWRFVLAEPAPRLLAVNADEGEPGTFKDRVYLERDPHRMLEGMLIAAWAVEADEIYIYLRDEYPEIRALLRREIGRLEASRAALPTIHLRRGAGAYICGEESAMLESIEGKRGLPRQRPPFPAQVGLFGRPTLIHNVETLYWVRELVERGAEWFTSQGRNGCHGLRSFSVSGRVREPGVKLAPAGITARQLIDEYCGGMADGHVLKAYLPGGASGGILPARLADLPLDFGTLAEHGAFIGSAAVMVLSESDDVGQAALNLLRFFEDESCGQCTPCRLGCEKAVRHMAAGKWRRGLLEELAAAMADASICGLGQAAPNPFLSVLKYFPEEVT